VRTSKARRLMRHSSKARRLMRHSSKARNLGSRTSKARRLISQNSKALTFRTYSCRARRSSQPTFKVRRSNSHGFKVQGYEMHSSKARCWKMFACKRVIFQKAILWRTNPATPTLWETSAIRFPDSSKAWEPLFWKDTANNRIAWTSAEYTELRNELDSIPKDERAQALQRVERLDCSNPDLTLTPCDPSRPPSRAAAEWQKLLEMARVDDATYIKALASVLRAAACVNQDNGGFYFAGGRSQHLLDYSYADNAAFVLRGLMSSGTFGARLADAGLEAPDMIDFIMGSNCPVSASLTEGDKARLRQIKQAAIESAGRP
jgi:hypothetical protein